MLAAWNVGAAVETRAYHRLSDTTRARGIWVAGFAIILLGAGAALWGVSDSGFSVPGVFRYLADVAGLVLFRKDSPGQPVALHLPARQRLSQFLKFDFDI